MWVLQPVMLQVCYGQLTYPWSYFFMDRKNHMHFMLKIITLLLWMPCFEVEGESGLVILKKIGVWKSVMSQSVLWHQNALCLLRGGCWHFPAELVGLQGEVHGEMPALCSCHWGHSEQKCEIGNIKKMMFSKVRQKVFLSPVVFLQFLLRGWYKKTSPSQPANCEVRTPWSL